MNYEVIKKTVSAFPIPTDDVKKHCNIEADFVEDDELVDGMTKASERFCSGIIGSDIYKTTNVHTFSKYTGGSVRVRENPLSEFVSVKHTPEGEAEVTLLEADYKVVESQFFFDVEFTNSLGSGKLVLEYKTGYDDNKIPSELKHAIKIQVSTYYDAERSGYGDYKMKANRAVQNLLAPHIRLL